MEIKRVPINSLKEDINQPRKIFDEGHLKGLAESLLVEGMINPIECSEDLIIITGACRFRAAKLLGWKEVPININHDKLSEYERFRRQMAENLHQSAAGGSSPMNAIDVANGYRRLIKMRTGKDYEPGSLSREEIYGLMKDIPKELGVATHTVWEYLKLLDEPEYVLEDIKKGIPRTFYREIAKVPKEYQETLKKAVSKGKITDRNSLTRFGHLARVKPEVAAIELLRITEKQNTQVNRILSRAVELGLALREVNADTISISDRNFLIQNLIPLIKSITIFLEKLKKAGEN